MESMQWLHVLAGVPTLAVGDRSSAEIDDVVYDSRKVTPGAVFVAMRGDSTDGNRYVRTALDAGAAAIVTDSRESFAYAGARGVPVALVEHGRRALAGVTANLLHHPESQLSLTAVTGTNGKTTTAFLIESLLRSARRKAVLLGTIETHIAGVVLPSLHTTPESRDILHVFASGVAAGCTEAVMEMSSHALEQERVWGLPVDVAVFTNLTQDHLDYHATMESYAAAKARLFTGVGAPPPRVAVINLDDAWTGTMLRAASACGQSVTYSLVDPEADLFAYGTQYKAGSTLYMLRWSGGEFRITSQLTGRVNVYNQLAAIAAAHHRGVSVEALVEASSQLRPVPGRFEAVPNELGFSIIVDYAHTDDALRNLLGIARDLTPEGRLLTVFGCGGDRDRTKRPKMGAVAADGSDVVIVTNDNPRSEDPAAIAKEVLAGMSAADRARASVVLDRAEAIALAIGQARPGDTILIAGKGHEKTQTGRDGVFPFDDVAVAAEVLRAEERARCS